MNRYTEKSTDIRDKDKYEYTMIADEKPYWTYVNEDGVTLYERIIRKAFEKLGKLEDIEEELGIDLVTLFKAITYGFFYKHKYRNYPTTIEFADTYRKFIYREGADEKNAWCIGADGMDEYTPIFYLKDYGKTWALTKEELE